MHFFSETIVSFAVRFNLLENRFYMTGCFSSNLHNTVSIKTFWKIDNKDVYNKYD